jgi:hypothetical protein
MGEGETRNWCFKEHRILVWDDEKSLERNNGNHYATT